MDAQLARLAVAAAGSLALAGCGASTEAPPPSPATGTIDTCPAAPPAASARAITLDGVTGRATVVPPTDRTAPRVTVEAPFRVDRSRSVVAEPGSGATLTEKSVVTVCYQGVNGRTGAVFDDAFARATSAEVALPDVVPGFRAALVGQRSGATVVTAVTSADGYPKGEPRAGADPGDTLVFAIRVLAAN
ncbi:FKBP-type peptidyl-prolyl cis-trans isomerase [Tsukamurella paurometabola]|uniref:Peptidyl-prolyl cis-trans isomerase n=1 Tax=Tsukamurella paurometabola TaxID=2061 RepID=A0A3P8KTF8_TSUPA|nr:FKBP-type peptidyl-prolyl cis-trans isomerase [Tsukamurella paurometabola]MBS4102737.1 FKBP-type peptidyl-prolyl cis-trans isomerase [Tsukamurella paurometabola]UEA82992.1 FKBP-type peptidyl-prolyl cis-trans isomerase [Tsukamurella paurometabola]VDR40077.1 FKBP-type peptidyl-prolyl cis-trans isomerase [Tsukamurella paurometabola]